MREATFATPQRVSSPRRHVVHPACSVCQHVRRVTETDTGSGASKECTYDLGCPECGCVASDGEYDAGFAIGSDDDFAAFAAGRPNDGTTVVAPGRFRLHQGARVGGSVQRPDSAERSVRNRIHPAGSNLAELGILGGTMAGHGEPAGSGRIDALCPLWLVTVVNKICVWLGLIEKPGCTCTTGEGCLRTGGSCR